MAKMRRANVVIHVEDTEVDRYIDLGYVQVDDAGNIIKKGIPSNVTDLQKAYAEHLETIARLEAEIAELKKPSTATKKSKKSETTVG